MNTRGWVIAATIMAGGLLSVGSVAQPAGARAAAVHRAASNTPIVIELFTAQGCSDCLDANAAVEAASDDPGVIALTYGVDYWDYLGWSDTFARPKFTERQRAYRAALRLRNVSTPQVVIGGHRQVSGARAELDAVLSEEAARMVYPPQIEFRETGRAVGVGSGRVPAGGAEVLAVTYVPGSQVVDVARGDNRGRSVRHVNVVRDIVRLGDWSGRPRLYDLPPALGEGEAMVVLVQDKRDRRIIGAATRD